MAVPRRSSACFRLALGAFAGLLAASFVLSPLGPIQYQQLLSALSLHEARAGFGMVGALMNIGLPSLIAEAVSIIAAMAVLGLSLLGYGRATTSVSCSTAESSHRWSRRQSSVVISSSSLPRCLSRGSSTVAPVAVLASWAIAPPHGQHLDTDLIDGITSSGTWSVVAVASVVLMVSSSRRMRRSNDGAT